MAGQCDESVGEIGPVHAKLERMSTRATYAFENFASLVQTGKCQNYFAGSRSGAAAVGTGSALIPFKPLSHPGGGAV